MSSRPAGARRTLDHVGVGVDDLAAAHAAYVRLGFAPAPLAHHMKRRDDGALYRSGTGNHCLVFEAGFVELLGVTDAATHPGWLPEYLARYRGLHILGFGSDDIEADAARMRAVAPSIVTRQLYQTMSGDSDAPLAAFGVIDAPRALTPECHVVALEHQTPDRFFDPRLTVHPNGATALVGARILVADPAGFAARLAGLFPCEVEAKDAYTLLLDRACVEIVDEAGLRRLAPELMPPTVPWMASFGVSVKDIAATGRMLRSRGVAFARRDDGALTTSPAEGCGAAVTFSEARP
jgi:hypothetical protein